MFLEGACGRSGLRLDWVEMLNFTQEKEQPVVVP